MCNYGKSNISLLLNLNSINVPYTLWNLVMTLISFTSITDSLVIFDVHLLYEISHFIASHSPFPWRLYWGYKKRKTLKSDISYINILIESKAILAVLILGLYHTRTKIQFNVDIVLAMWGGTTLDFHPAFKLILSSLT